LFDEFFGRQLRGYADVQHTRWIFTGKRRLTLKRGEVENSVHKKGIRLNNR
jgi:hypothetical protein